MAGGGAGDANMKNQGLMEAHFARAAAPAARAERALNKAINTAAYKDDLVQKIVDGHVKMEGIKGKDLPASMASKSAEAQQREIAGKVADRKELQAKIVDLSKQRDSYLQSHMAGGGAAGFDKVVGHALAAQVGK